MSIPKGRENLNRRESAPAIKLARLFVVWIRARFCDGLDLEESNVTLPKPSFSMGEKTGAMSLAPKVCPDRDAVDVPSIREVFAQRKESDHSGPVCKCERGHDRRVSGIHEQSTFNSEPHGKRAKYCLAFRCALEVGSGNIHAG